MAGMSGLQLFLLPPATQAAFARHFSSSRRSSDLLFFTIQCFVTLSYCRVASLAQVLLRLSTTLVPVLAYLALPNHASFRTPIVVAIKLCVPALFLMGLLNDFYDQQQGHSWPSFLFKLLHTGRVLWFLASGIGLQLPLVLDLPLQLLGTALAVLVVVPRQCQPGRAPDGMATLYDLNRDKFATIASVLDMPFAPFIGAQEALGLSDQGMCSAVYVWVQLVVALGVPATFHFMAEVQERKRFLGAGAQARQNGHGNVASSWPYFLLIAQACWCVVRTAAGMLF